MYRFLVVALLVVSCNSKSNSAPETNGAATATSPGRAATAKFTLTEAGNDSNKVNVEFAVPSSWQPNPSGPQPAWKLDGATMLQLVTVDAGGSDNASRVASAAKMQFDKEPAPTRNEYPDGRVWMTQPSGALLQARMFVPYAGGVVMGFAMLKDPSKLDGVKAAFETLKIAQ